MIIKQLLLSSIVIFANPCIAELKQLEDAELSAVDGEGIGLVWEDFAFEAGEDLDPNNRLDISELVNDQGQPVVLSVSRFYIAGDNSNEGANVIGNTVNLGRLNNPYNLELVDGDTIGIQDKAVFEFSAPKRANNGSLLNESRSARPADNRCNHGTACNSRVDSVSGINRSVLSSRSNERFDTGIRFDMVENGTPAQKLDIHARGVAVDGSNVRIWGDDSRSTALSNLAISLVADDLTVYASNPDGSGRGTSVVFQDVAISAELGYGDKQPVSFEVNGDGNFELNIGSKTSACADLNSSGGCSLGSAGYQDFYNNGPRADVYINNVSVGGQNFGSSTISNLQIQYLNVRSRDLTQ